MIIRVYDQYGGECYYTCSNIFNAFEYCKSLLHNDSGIYKLIIVVFLHDDNNSKKMFDVYIDYYNKELLFTMS